MQCWFSPAVDVPSFGVGQQWPDADTGKQEVVLCAYCEKRPSTAWVNNMNRDYLNAAGVFVGAGAMIAVVLAWLEFLQSECLQGTPFLAAIFPCFQ
jgi:hypothetical protein